MSPVFQADWRVRLQVDLQTLRHTLLCVLCGLLGEWIRNFRLNPGKVWGDQAVSSTVLSAIHCLLTCYFYIAYFTILGFCGDTGQMLRERLWAWLNFSRRQGRKCPWIIQKVVFETLIVSLCSAASDTWQFSSCVFYVVKCEAPFTHVLPTHSVLFSAGPQHSGRDGDGWDGPGDQHEWNHHTGGCPEQDGEIWGMCLPSACPLYVQFYSSSVL